MTDGIGVNTLRWIIVFALMLMLWTGYAFAQHSQVSSALMPLAFDCQCTDPVGAAYAKALPQAIANSGKFTLAPKAAITDSQGNVTKSYWHLSIMSMDPSPTTAGQYSVLSVVVLLGNRNFMLQDMQACSKTQVNLCAQSTLKVLNQFLRELGH
uniref:Uncharacterized protein n=1 Tax=Acidobacterium capsulatum TaxID=33075 RepID=A0A7V4XRV3_9BACT